uniref:Heparosan-N-sulfate-glucuronate 5-epimerase n=1 Tax=Bursaphelenchus xylophilus TaxID=6326 RepID=A0A1I7SSB4_BURXY
MRVRLEKVFVLIVVVVVGFFYFVSTSNDSSPLDVDCLIEGTRRIHCIKKGIEIYFPFNFIKKQFDVNGKWVTDTRFEYYTSYSKSKKPDMKNYSSFGSFGNFGSYNVEKRDRVGCIHGTEQVPMSIQWQSIPYFYPIQISQFGLQHFSRLQTDPPPKLHKILKDNINRGNFISFIKDDASYIRLNDLTDTVTIDLNSDPDLSIILFKWTPLNYNSYFSILVRDINDTLVILKYVIEDDKRCVWSNKSNLYYQSLNAVVNSSMDVTRDFIVDIIKATSSKSNSDQKIDFFKPISISFNGPSQLQFPIIQQSSAHKELFLNAANWLLRHQDEDGIWPVPVKRNIVDKKLTLKPGWSSAMAQGHGISTLVRAYHLTKEEKYKNAARQALSPYERLAVDGGVKNEVFGLPWYEEYPTTPPSLVLNGFIYSLIGLYDFSQIENGTAWRLFQDGLNSLNQMLPLYDTGSGSVYDLRHLFLKTAPNLARWDYHKVHIYLLRWLHIITKEKIYYDYSERWLLYSTGKRAKHN